MGQDGIIVFTGSKMNQLGRKRGNNLNLNSLCGHQHLCSAPNGNLNPMRVKLNGLKK
jgi:hypothetical protein